MKKTICQYTKITAAIVMGVALNQAQLAMAGWSGTMNGSGYGKALVNVVSAAESAKTLSSINMTNPSVAMTTDTNYAYSTTLPKDSSKATTAKVKGFPGYVWQANTVGSNGDSTDSTQFPGVQIDPADCASLEMASSSAMTDAKSGTITVTATGTAGTALRVRGYEFLGALIEDDLSTTNVDETLEYLKSHGSLKWDIILLGPFNLNTTNCTALVIPFTIETDPNNLYYVTDGVAKSNPLIIVCPNNVVTNCTSPFAYPPVTFAGCGNVTLSYSPPEITPGGLFPAGSFPVGVTPVTVTATDKDGNTTNCTFTVTITDTTAPAIPVLATVTGTCGSTVTLPVPTTTDGCGGTVTVSPNVAQTFTNAGINRVQWTFTDAAGNSSTAYQTGIVASLTFQGFYSPVGTANNTIDTPVTRTAGASFPLKWDLFCGTTQITGSTPGSTPPVVTIQKVNNPPGPITNIPAEFQNDWHINWPTPSTSKNDIYRATVITSGQTNAVLFVKFK